MNHVNRDLRLVRARLKNVHERRDLGRWVYARDEKALGWVLGYCMTSAAPAAVDADVGVAAVGFATQTDGHRSAVVAVGEAACWIAAFGFVAVAGRLAYAALKAVVVVGENTAAVAEDLDAVSER